MMLPAPPQFLQPRPIMMPDDIPTSATESKVQFNPFIPNHMKSSIIGAHSVPLSAYSARPLSSSSPDMMSLNMNEYMPTAASSRISTTIFNPNSLINTVADKMGFMPSNNFQMMAQRA